MQRDRYLFVGGPLDGQVLEHDGLPVISGPADFKWERVGGESLSEDVATYRVSTGMALYTHRSVQLEQEGAYLRVMSCLVTPVYAGLVARSLCKALGLTLWAAANEGAKRL